jgi:uncharacterized membrane protein YbhN (UPF0104 family)
LKKTAIRKLIGVLVILVFFYFIGNSLYRNWNTIVEAKLKFNVFFLILSYIFTALTFLLVAYTWKRNLAILNENIGFVTALKINALATLPKYAPGKVWGIAGKVYLAKKEGISEHNCIITISLETILYLLGGLILFIITASSVLNGRVSYNLYLLIIPICLFIIYPRIIIGITNFFLRIFKRPIIDFMPSYFQILVLLLLYTLSWVLMGIGFSFLINSFYPIAYNKILIISGLHAFSWVVGFLSIITPAGLGVREGIFSYFLTFLMPGGIATLVSLLVRIWGTIGEVAFALIFISKIKKYL